MIAYNLVARRVSWPAKDKSLPVQWRVAIGHCFKAGVGVLIQQHKPTTGMTHVETRTRRIDQCPSDGSGAGLGVGA